MKVTVFGATGGTGREAVQLLLDAGHEVTAHVRDPAKLALEHAKLRVVQGSMSDVATVADSLSGQDGVLCCIGPSPSRAREVTVCTDSTKIILEQMQRAGRRRLVVLTAFGSGDSKTWGLSAWMTRKVMPGIMEDKDRQEALVAASELDWTVVRPPTLTKGPRTGRYRVHEQARFWPWDRISRADVADCMIGQLERDEYVGRAICIRA